ncbi:MAG TPA: amylo-alpha-1,6-glucosidase [Acidimicrobiia bacterium]|nr:amylo-alpha-1,6-glucosidase [Acidimicrobiia bacterium]
MTDGAVVRPVTPPTDADPARQVQREWLVTNGMGGYASGTVSGLVTRRYHGWLVAALPNPLGRTVMLTHVSEQVGLPGGRCVDLGAEETEGRLELRGDPYLTDFSLVDGLPRWRYDIDGTVLEKRVVLAHRHNLVHFTYRLVTGDGEVLLELRPSMHFRHYEAAVNSDVARYSLLAVDDRYEIVGDPAFPPLRLRLHARDNAFTHRPRTISHVVHRAEQSRGYDSRGDLWSPGYFQVRLQPGEEATLVAATEPWEVLDAGPPAVTEAAELARRSRLLRRAPAPLRDAMPELVFAADQFIIEPVGREAAAGEEVRSVIAGYHWFSDWGRDTMISLEGLCLLTGRHREAGSILRMFGHHVRDGLIPNLFPDGDSHGLYHTADATLWFFHAIARYEHHTGDRETLRLLLPVLADIVERHVAGTRFGIGVDPADGLLRAGAPGLQLTWMDAKVDDWVVTPRRGKPVEINALWYQALCLLEEWSAKEGFDVAVDVAALRDTVSESFNRRFWYEAGSYLYDVVDREGGGDDPTLRPNQVLAVSLPRAVLRPDRWAPVVETVRRHLLTPVGLRTLDPEHPDYKPRYDGDLRARDGAYHQGTVWPWLLGPFVDAWLKAFPERTDEARAMVGRLHDHLGQAGIGSVSEIFDAEEPFTPRGCIAQAWSVAELIRATASIGAPGDCSAL